MSAGERATQELYSSSSSEAAADYIEHELSPYAAGSSQPSTSRSTGAYIHLFL